jgi:AcrR family transcriptional regulator
LSSHPGRKAPSQDRSRQRVERIVAAATDIFAEVGFDAATMEAIAERAGVSIGSLYQYFPNKLSVFEAIYESYHARERAVVEKQLVAAAMINATWDETIDRAVDAFDYLRRTEPAFRAVWLNWMHSPRIVEAGLAENAEFAERVEAIVGLYAPALPASRKRLVARMTVEIISSMMFMSTRVDDELGRDLVEETKLLLKRYLAPIVSERRPSAADVRSRKARAGRS